MLLPILLILIPRLSRKAQRNRQRRERNTSLVHLVHSRLGVLMLLINTEDVDSVARTGDMKTPVPCSSHIRGLCVEGVIPAANDNLNPPLNITREIERPSPPRPAAFLG